MLPACWPGCSQTSQQRLQRSGRNDDLPAEGRSQSVCHKPIVSVKPVLTPLRQARGDGPSSAHLQDLLEILRLRLGHLCRCGNVLFQVSTHVLPSAETLEKEVRGLPSRKISAIHHDVGAISLAYLIAVRPRDGLVITHGSATTDARDRTRDGGRALGELLLHGTGRSRHCCWRGRILAGLLEKRSGQEEQKLPSGIAVEDTGSAISG